MWNTFHMHICDSHWDDCFSRRVRDDTKNICMQWELWHHSVPPSVTVLGEIRALLFWVLAFQLIMHCCAEEFARCTRMALSLCVSVSVSMSMCVFLCSRAQTLPHTHLKHTLCDAPIHIYIKYPNTFLCGFYILHVGIFAYNKDLSNR